MASYGLPFGPDGNPMQDSPAQGLRDDLTLTLRSIRDTLSTSFQTLNLTMSSLQGSIRTMTSSFTPGANRQPNSTYVPTFGASAFTGAMSQPMQQHIANTSMYGLMTGAKPFNVSGMEYAQVRQQELQSRYNQFGVAAATETANMGFGSLVGWGASRFATSSMAPAALRNFAGSRMFGMSGAGIIGGVAGLGAGMVGGMYAGALQNESEIYGRDIAGIKRMSTRFGNEFTDNQSRVAARSISNYGHNELMNSNDFDTKLGAGGYRQVMMQGLQMGMFQGHKPEELVKQVEGAASVVKFLTGVLGSKDVQETMEQVGKLKSMGVNAFQSPDFIKKMGMGAYSASQQMGVPAAQLLQQATQYGAQAYGQFGMPSFGGIIPTMQNMSLAHEMEKRKMLSAAEISVGGGHSSIAGRYTSMMAGMLSHPAIGGMMLASGMDSNGQFDAARYNGVARGDIFSSMADAAGRLTDPHEFTKFKMNQSNLIAGAAANGGLEPRIEEYLNKALDGMPNITTESDVAFMVQKIAQSNGTPIGEAEAKMFALKRMRPGTHAAILREGAKGVTKGLYRETSLRYGKLRGLGELGEAIERIPGDIYNASVTRPAQDLHDRISNLIGNNDHVPGESSIGGGEFNGNTIINAKAFHQFNTNSDNRFNTNVDSKTYKDAYDIADREAMLGGKTGFWAKFRPGMSDAAQGLAPALEAQAAKESKFYYGAANNKDGPGFHESFANIDKYLNLGTSNDNNKVANAYKSQMGKYAGANAAGTHFLADQMTKDQTDDLTSTTRNSSWFTNANKGDLTELLKSAGINPEDFSKEDSDKLMKRILGDDKDGTIAKYAKANGMSMSNVAYGITNKQMGGDESLSNFYKLKGANAMTEKNVNIAGLNLDKQTGNTGNIDRRSLLSDDSGMSLDTSLVHDSLSSIGLDYEDVRSLSDKEGSQGDLEAYGKAVTKFMNDDAVGKDDFAAIKSPMLRARLDTLMSTKTSDAHGGEENYKMSSAEAVRKKIKGDKLLGTGDISKNISGLMGKVGESASKDQITDGIKNIWGFKTDDAHISDALNQGNLPDFIDGLKTDNIEGKRVQEQLRDLKGKSWDDLKSMANVGTDTSTYEKTLQGVTGQIMSTSLSTDKLKSDEAKIVKDPINKAVDQELNALRTVAIGKDLDEAKQKLRDVNVPSTWSTLKTNAADTYNRFTGSMPGGGPKTASNAKDH